jgi:hypothetical protein
MSAPAPAGVAALAVAELGCTVAPWGLPVGAAASSASARVVTAVTVARPTVPMLTDAVLINVNGTRLRLKSAWGAWVEASGAAWNAWNSTDGSSSLAARATVDAAVATAAAGGAAAGPVWSHSNTALDVLLGGSTHVVLITDAVFHVSTRVALGGAPCRHLWLSGDGHQLHLRTPALEEVCGTSTTCGYQPLTLSSDEPTQANFSCPPFCPGLLPGTTPVVLTAAGTLVPAILQPGSLPVRADAQGLAAGFFLTETCARGGYTDPASGACTNTSSPDFGRCGFGSGSDCRACPEGAICPGGTRAWPMPGFYSASATSGRVSPCAAPRERCAGWNASLDAVQCAVGYRQHSYGCAACADRYFLDAFAACSPCPSSIQLWDIARPLLVFVAALIGVTATLYAVLAAAARAVGGRLHGGVWRALDFMAYAATTIQVIAQVGQAASAGLPPLLRAVYAAVNVFQFTGVALPPSCLGGNPFIGQLVEFSLVLACLCALCSLMVKAQSSSAQRRARRTLVKTLFTALLLLYPIVTNAALGLVHCTAAEVQGRAYAGLDADSRVVDAAATVTVTVLTAQPFHVCYEGQHRPVGYLAWVVLALYTVGYPLITLAWVRRRLAMAAAASAAVNAGLTASAARARRGGLRSPTLDSDVASLAAMRRPRSSAVLVKGGSGSMLGASSPHALKQRLLGPFAALASPAPAQPADPPYAAAVSHPELAPFIAGDYRASAFWFRHIDLGAMLWLSLVLVLWSSPTTGASIVAKAAATVACPVLVLALLWRVRPYPPSVRWKLPVRSLALLVTVAAAGSNCATALAAAPGIAEALSLVVVALSAALLLTLLVAFGVSSVSWARADKAADAAQRASRLGRASPRSATPRHVEDASVENPLLLRSASGQALLVAPRRRGAGMAPPPVQPCAPAAGAQYTRQSHSRGTDGRARPSLQAPGLSQDGQPHNDVQDSVPPLRLASGPSWRRPSHSVAATAAAAVPFGCSYGGGRPIRLQLRRRSSHSVAARAHAAATATDVESPASLAGVRSTSLGDRGRREPPAVAVIVDDEAAADTQERRAGSELARPRRESAAAPRSAMDALRLYAQHPVGAAALPVAMAPARVRRVHAHANKQAISTGFVAKVTVPAPTTPKRNGGPGSRAGAMEPTARRSH